MVKLSEREIEMIGDVIKAAYKGEILPIQHDDVPSRSNQVCECRPEDLFRIEIELSVRAVDLNNSERILTLHCSGYNNREIADQVDLSNVEVSRRLHKLLFKSAVYMDYGLRQRCLWAWPQMFEVVTI